MEQPGYMMFNEASRLIVLVIQKMLFLLVDLLQTGNEFI